MIKNNIVIKNKNGEIIYEGHNVGTRSGATAVAALLSNEISNTYSNQAEGKPKYLFIGNASSLTTEQASDSAMNTAATDLKAYTAVAADVTPASATADASVKYVFNIPSGDSFQYNELGLAGDDDATFDPNNTTAPHQTYILYARHTLPTTNVKESTTELTIEWTVTVKLSVS